MNENNQPSEFLQTGNLGPSAVYLMAVQSRSVMTATLKIRASY